MTDGGRIGLGENPSGYFLSSCLETPLEELTAILNRSFEGYVVPIHLNSAALANMVRVDAVDLTASRIVWRGEAPVGIGLIARRGWNCRLAAMGIVANARGQGAGRWLLDRLVAEAISRAERVMYLEVIEQNPAAVNLYEKAGFRRIGRLVGYRGEGLVGEEHSELREVSLTEVASVLLDEEDEVPWQAAGEGVGQTAYPNRGFRLGPAVASITDPDQSQIAIRSIGVPRDQRGKGAATRLVSALVARFPQRIWRVAPIFPARGLRAPFERVGFELDTISQFQMRRDLTRLEQN